MKFKVLCILFILLYASSSKCDDSPKTQPLSLQIEINDLNSTIHTEENIKHQITTILLENETRNIETPKTITDYVRKYTPKISAYLEHQRDEYNYFIYLVERIKKALYITDTEIPEKSKILIMQITYKKNNTNKNTAFIHEPLQNPISSIQHESILSREDEKGWFWDLEDFSGKIFDLYHSTLRAFDQKYKSNQFHENEKKDQPIKGVFIFLYSPDSQIDKSHYVHKQAYLY